MHGNAMTYHRYTLLDMLLRIIHVAHGSIFVNPIGPSGGGNRNTVGMIGLGLLYLLY